MRQPGRSISGSSSWQWLSMLLLLIAPDYIATQYASSLYNRQVYGYSNPQQVEQPLYVEDPPLTYGNQEQTEPQYPVTGQSIWSSAPIVVNDEANSPELQRRGYFPIIYNNNNEPTESYGNVGADRRRQSNWSNYNVPTTTRAANHNYNHNIPRYFYYNQPQAKPQSQQELEQRELLAVSDSRRDEEQVVRIGGSPRHPLAEQNFGYNGNSNNNNYYFQPAEMLQRRDFEAKYAKHYSDYLRKYPRRLQPFYNTGPTFVDK